MPIEMRPMLWNRIRLKATIRATKTEWSYSTVGFKLFDAR